MYSGQLSDEVLAARIVQGGQSAFETLYDRHASMVLGVIFRIIGERKVAEEVLQEIFWRIWQGAVMYQPQQGPFAGWLFRIARDLAIDTKHRNVRSKPINGSTDMAVSERTQLNFKTQQARDAWNILTSEQRQVIELTYFQSMTRQEIAEATGESPGTIHSRARSGLQKFREALEGIKFEF
jgi:RNA polymerase sigma-70 factor (ECF subfamily)